MMRAMPDDVDPERTRVTSTDPLLGYVLVRRYHIAQRLGAGGFGRVYRARDLVERRDVAVKVLHPSQAADPGISARFRREAAALRRLNHRHTVAMYGFGETSRGLLFIAMELLQGESLWDRFRAHGRLPWWRVLRIVRQVCSALAQAHALDVIHRDLKPENIHLERGGDDTDFVKVVDFGIAKILRGSRAETADLTASGVMIGTFDYMAPEQMVGGECGPGSDIFTLGVVMYEMIAGLRPFGETKSTSAMLSAIVAGPPMPLSQRAGAPSELDPIVARCLAPDHRQRYEYADELGADLERVLQSVPEAPDRTSTALQVQFDDEAGTFLSDPPSFVQEGATDPFERRTGEAMPDTPTGATLPGTLPPGHRR
jgi:serine/threonine-protein kinase